MNNQHPGWSKDVLEQIVHRLAMDSANVVFTEHCLERLSEREITNTEALRCLQRGSIVREPIYNATFNTYEIRLSEKPPRDIVCMVVGVPVRENPNQVIAITVWEV